MDVRRVIDRLRRADLRLFRRISGWRGTPFHALRQRAATPVERILGLVTRSADMSRLWIAAAAGLFALDGRTGKRAAVRGLGSIALTSAIVNLLFKPLVHRRRPELRGVPPVRRLTRQPLTTSFPSGHAASAAAFATGVAVEKPRAGLLLAPLAAAVGYSRSFVGVHYPGDVAGGWLLGGGMAIAVRRTWPPLPDPEQIAAKPPAPLELPSIPNGEGAAVVFNPGSGSRRRGPSADDLRALLPRARVEEVAGESLEDAVRRATSGADIVGVCGGDGTLIAAAEVAAEQRKPLLLMPGGTMNHLAHDLGLRAPIDAATAAAEGRGVAIDHATVNGQMFLNNASVGVYPAIVALRQRLERLGRWPAQLVAIAWALCRQRPVELEIDGRRRVVWMLWVGNGEYHERGLLPGWRHSLDDGMLDVRIMPVRRPVKRLRGVLAAASASAGRLGGIERLRPARLEVDAGRDGLVAIRDGELFEIQGRVAFENHHHRLRVYAG
ncbi:MAG TPA: phosphatase PAP2 family protein [Solirubrobacterales bacterium]|nr:phosphatase PAP2 family protein [Solirubrobacterales bacterium]